MDKKYLLTYQHIKFGTTFAWFESEDKMIEFTKRNDVLIILGSYKINDIEHVDI